MSTILPENEFIFGITKDGFGRNKRVVEAIDALNFLSSKTDGLMS